MNMTMKIVLGVLVLGVVVFYFLKSGIGSTSLYIKNINKEELKAVIKANPKVQLVDVRTASEIKGGMIQPAVHIDVHSSNFADRFKDFDKEQPIYLYCRSGMRSGRACKILEKNGFTEIYNLTGGYSRW